MHAWQLQEAKSRFSELVELVLKEGPQLVTRRGEEAVVILSAKDYRRLSGQTPTLKRLVGYAETNPNPFATVKSLGRFMPAPNGAKKILN